MRDVLEVVPIAILGISKAGRITFINERGRELFGYRSDELDGACASLLIPAWSTHGVHVIAPKPPFATSVLRTVVARCHDGAEFPAEVTTSQCRVDGVPILLAVVVERSERDELHRNRQELAHLARVSALGELAGSLAHELNQPLTAILSNSQAAQRFMEADPINLREVRETLKDIVADNRRAGEIIQKMRALVRKCDIEWQWVDVSGVVHDVASLVHSDAIVRGVRITIQVAPGLPSVRGDKVQLQQVLLNLMLNALDAVQDRTAADRLVAVQARVDTGGAVCLCVRDHGRGLTVDQMDKIFQPFFTSKPHGLGLGLSISRSIVGAHGGRIWAENNAEGGASFYVSLPAGNAAGPNRM
ncbi:PAS domain-containing sensor histidine kinase [Paraburkholderia ginsengiterrae]|uniref:PAS domain-containing sensor histidine kinase n=1 Tax=Paraburkholderia ginsengiterrae TaxID=1462993 RepID=UPI00094FBB2F|nr:ATP-binding protein [Paraburkholderia ginsengiterrae]